MEKRRWKKKRVVRKDTVDFCRNWIPIRKKEQSGTRSPQYENQFHEVKQETIESVYRWEKENAELHLQSDLLQEMAREIEKYTTETDYWNIRGLANGEFERKSQELSGKVLQQSRELSDRRLEKDGICEELEQWKNQKEPEPERSEVVEKNRRLLKEKEFHICSYIK